MDDLQPLISVVVPVYNTGSFLQNCLDSILSQTLREIEVLLVDDGTDDPLTLEILDEYKARDSRIRLIKKANGGQASARNKGHDEASGRYVAFVDHDDILNTTMYETLFREAEKTGADVVECRFEPLPHDRVDRMDGCRSSSVPFVTVSIDQDRDFLVDHIQIWNRIYRNEFLRENHLEFDDLLWEEDVLFSFKVLITAGSLSFLDDTLYYHIEHDSNTTHKLGPKIFHAFKAHDLLFTFMNDRHCTNMFEEQYFGRVFKDILFGFNVIDEACEKDFFMEAHGRIKDLSLTPYRRFFSSSKKKLLGYVKRGDYRGFKRYQAFRERRKHLMKHLFRIRWTPKEKSMTVLGFRLGG